MFTQQAKKGYLPRPEFDRLHRRRIDSPEWKAFVRALKIERNFRCAVCGTDYQKSYGKWQLIGDHKRYWKGGTLIFGRETAEDVRLVCPGCNKKGVRSDAAIKSARTAHDWVRRADGLFYVMTWVLRLPLRLSGRLVRYLWRCLWHAPRSVD